MKAGYRVIAGKTLEVDDCHVRRCQFSLPDENSDPVDHMVTVCFDNKGMGAIGHHLDKVGLCRWMNMHLRLLKQKHEARICIPKRGCGRNLIEKREKACDAIADILEVSKSARDIYNNFECVAIHGPDVDVVKQINPPYS